MELNAKPKRFGGKSLVSIVSQILSFFGVLLFQSGRPIYMKTSISLLSSLIFSIATDGVWPKFSFAKMASLKGQANVFKSLIPHNPKAIMRMIFASVFTLTNIYTFQMGLSSSKPTNCFAFILIQFFSSIVAGNAKVSKLGQIMSSFVIGIALLIVSFSQHFQQFYFILSVVSAIFCHASYPHIIASFQANYRFVSSLLLFCFIFSLAPSIVVDKFSFNFPLFQTIISGILIWQTANFFSIPKSPISVATSLSFTVIPASLAIIFSIPSFQPSLLLSSAVAYFGSTLAKVAVSETVHVLSKPRSILFFLLATFCMMVCILQCVFANSYSQLWRKADSIYIFLLLRVSIGEIFDSIGKTTTSRFSFGYGRVSSIGIFSVSVISILRTITILPELSTFVSSQQRPSILTIIPSFLAHILIFAADVLIPKSNSYASMINAVNINAEVGSKRRFKPRDFLTELIGSILAVCAQLLPSTDKFIAALYAVLTICDALPTLLKTGNELSQGMDNEFANKVSKLKEELGCGGGLASISKINAWKCDESLSVATMSAEAPPSETSKTQDFLLYCISRFQQIGVLDITTEVTGGEFYQSGL